MNESCLGQVTATFLRNGHESNAWKKKKETKKHREDKEK